MPTPMNRRLASLLAVTAVALALPAAAAAEPYDPDSASENTANNQPSPSVAPTINGVASVGGTLTGNRGTWPAGTQLSSRWVRCNVGASTCDSTGDTDLSYTVGAADIGSVIKLRVVAVRPGVLGLLRGVRVADSAPTTTIAAPVIGEPPVNVSPPTITGTARVGFKLTAVTGQWRGTPPIAFNFSWFSCDTKGSNCLSRSTSDSYTPIAADAGRRLILTVLGFNPFGSSNKTVTSPVVAKALTVYKRLAPFPRLTIGGRVSGTLTTLTGFKLSRVPKGSTITMACTGRGCPFKRATVKTKRKTTVPVRRLQRGFRSGAQIVVIVRRGNTLGKYTRLKFRRRSAPSRVDRCVQPRSSKPVTCP